MSPRVATREPLPWQRRRIQVGEWKITELCDGSFRLDGGAMWGVVPKALWGRMTPSDGENTIPMALRPFLAERDGLRVLIEVGIGDRWTEKERRIYRIEPSTDLEASLRACGVAPEDVTHVVASHCHWDHIGAQVKAVPGTGPDDEAALVPRFPNARHFAPRLEVAMARHPDHARRGSYRAEDVTVIEEHGLLETFDGDAELLPGLRVRHVGGHSDAVSLVLLDGGEGTTAVFWADVVPTTHHIQPPYIMAYDIDVVRSFEQRSAWIARAADEGWIGLFYHDADEAFGRIVRDGRRYAFEPVASEVLEPIGSDRHSEVR